MFLQSISTRAFAPETRLEHWNDHVRQHFVGLTIDSAPDVKAELLSCNLGDVTIILATSQRASIKRWDREPPSVETKRRLLHLQHKGFSVIDQRSRCVPFSAGNLTYCNSDEPYGLQLSDNNAMLIVDVPDETVDPGAARTCELVARSTPAIGLLHDFAMSLLSQHWPEEIDPEEKAVLEQAVIGLAQSSFGHRQPEAWVSQPGDDRQRVLAFIERHLADSTLRTGGIAAALSLPVRTVQSIFVGMATTPTAYIISRRLGRAADLLTSRPETPITELAYEFGFSDTAHLCRLFKRRFGETPGRFAAARRADQR